MLQEAIYMYDVINKIYSKCTLVLPTDKNCSSLSRGVKYRALQKHFCSKKNVDAGIMP